MKPKFRTKSSVYKRSVYPIAHSNGIYKYTTYSDEVYIITIKGFSKVTELKTLTYDVDVARFIPKRENIDPHAYTMTFEPTGIHRLMTTGVLQHDELRDWKIISDDEFAKLYLTMEEE